MTDNNPIQMIKDLKFGNIIQRANSVFIDIPEFLNVSPNGQFIALGDAENSYLFDLKHPESSWHKCIAMESVNDVMPTDSGGYWISSYDNVQFISNHGMPALKRHCTWDHGLWGNDRWLLMHHEKELKYLNTSDFFIHAIQFKRIILHAWKHGDGLRLLSISRRKKKLSLYEWDCEESKPTRISTFSYQQDIQLSKKNYPHVHAWPLDDKAVLIKLIPWAITVSGDGNMSVSNDHVAWHPVMPHHALELNISRARLAELTACSLDHGMEASQGFSPHEKPFLITTLLQNDSIHFITTQWHKRLSIRHIDALTDTHLDACLDDHDVVSMLLANSERSLVTLQKNLPASLMHMLEEGITEYQFKRLLDQRHRQISRLFELYFPKVLNQQIDQSKEYRPIFLGYMYKNLQSISLRPLLIPVFFESFYDESVLCDEDQDWIESSIKMLVPILPEYIRNIIPERLLEDVPSFCQMLTEVDLPTADFLIGKAPDHLLDFEVFIFILDYFPSIEDIMLEIFIHRKHLWSEHESLDTETRSNLIHAIEDIFHCGVDFNDMLLPMVIAQQMFIPEHFEPKYLEQPHAHLIHLLVQHDIPVADIARFIAEQTATGDTFEADVIEPEIEIVQSKRLIPSIILTMLELSNARVLNDLLITLEICPVVAGCMLNAGDPRLEDMDFVIASIWSQGDDLDASTRWAFAVILLSAIKRSLSNDEIASLCTGHVIQSSHACLTEEAALLRPPPPKVLSPVEAMLACLSSETGINAAHKKISTAMLKHWEDD